MFSHIFAIRLHCDLVTATRKAHVTMRVTFGVTWAFVQIQQREALVGEPRTQLGRHEALRWAGATPVLALVSWPRKPMGSLRPNKIAEPDN